MAWLLAQTLSVTWWVAFGQLRCSLFVVLAMVGVSQPFDDAPAETDFTLSFHHFLSSTIALSIVW